MESRLELSFGLEARLAELILLVSRLQKKGTCRLAF